MVHWELIYFSDAGLELLRQERWSDLARLVDAFDVTEAVGALARFWLHVHAYRNRYKVRDIARAREQLDAMLEIDRDHLGPRELLALAEAMVLVTGNEQQARGLLDGLPEPDSQMRQSFGEETLRPFEPLLWRSRLGLSVGRSTVACRHYS